MAVSCHKESVRQDTPVGNWVVYSILKNHEYVTEAEPFSIGDRLIFLEQSILCIEYADGSETVPYSYSTSNKQVIIKNRLYNVGFQEKGKMTLSGDNITFLLTVDTTDKSGGHPMEID